jgi:hypothetical protein
LAFTQRYYAPAADFTVRAKVGTASAQAEDNTQTVAETNLIDVVPGTCDLVVRTASLSRAPGLAKTACTAGVAAGEVFNITAVINNKGRSAATDTKVLLLWSCASKRSTPAVCSAATQPTPHCISAGQVHVADARPAGGERLHEHGSQQHAVAVHHHDRRRRKQSAVRDWGAVADRDGILGCGRPGGTRSLQRMHRSAVQCS